MEPFEDSDISGKLHDLIGQSRDTVVLINDMLNDCDDADEEE